MIKIIKNYSLKNAIILALEGQEKKDYQLQILNPVTGVRLKHNGEEYLMFHSKIRVAYEKNKWIITEFKFGLNGGIPTKHTNDYELLEDFEAEIYW